MFSTGSAAVPMILANGSAAGRWTLELWRSRTTVMVPEEESVGAADDDDDPSWVVEDSPKEEEESLDSGDDAE